MWCILPIVFVFGASVGSFLNVVADRLPKKQSILKKRSYCDHCKHQLAWKDLIPIFSFILLKRRCRYCRKLISWQYPLVETISGFLFVLAYWLTFGWQNFVTSPLPLTQFIFLLFLFSCLLVIFVTDLKYGLILDEVVLVGSIFTLLYLVFSNFFPILAAYLKLSTANSQFSSYLLQSGILVERLKFAAFGLAGPIVAGFLTSLLFLVLLMITRGRGMGGGDVKFGFLIGLACGLPIVLVALFLSFLSGALVALTLVLFGKRKFGQTIPFGPFLSFGTLVAVAFGQQIIDWYTRFSYF